MLSLAGTAGLLRARPVSAAEGALETTKIRLFKTLAVCFAPQYVAEALLRAEGFTEVDYVDSSTMNIPGAIAAGEYDLGLDLVTDHILAMDQGAAITLLAGVHVGCNELYARDEIRSLTELKGKAVAVIPATGRCTRSLLWLQRMSVSTRTKTSAGSRPLNRSNFLSTARPMLSWEFRP